METLFITCLLIIIILLLQDKKVVNTKPDKAEISKKDHQKFPEIIGPPKTTGRHHKQETCSKCKIQELKVNPDNLDIEYDVHENLRIQLAHKELSSVETILQRDHLEPSQKETVVAIVQKIHGTELFNLLENSMESASHQIAKLLEGNISHKMESNTTIKMEDLNDFDMNEYL